MLLVVNHDEESLEWLQNALENEGYEVRTAVDCGEAIEVMVAELPRLVLLDVTSASAVGWQVVLRMKDDPVLAAVPICVMADSVDEAPVDASHVLAKPVGIDSILDVVRDFVS